jgi:hypothetical protein
MSRGTMKTSYYLVAAAGLTAVAVTVYDRIPARADSPPAMLPLPREPVGLAAATVPVLPAVPDVPLPPIVPPPDGDLTNPLTGARTALPTLPATPTSIRLPATPAMPTPSTPTLPSMPPATAPALPVIPSVAAPVLPPTSPTVPAPAALLVQQTPSAQPSIAPSPAPVKPGAPAEPKPLPLPAPTPFTPGLDSLHPEPAAKLPPTGKFVVLKGNRLVEGTAKIQGDKVIVRQGALDRSFARADVLCLADSRDGVYQYMRSKAGNNVDSRLAVAKWCTFNGLREQALNEAREILKLQPTHRGATDLARSVEESLRQFPANGSRPKSEGALVTVEEPAADVTAEAATTFISRAQPVLANQCMECHARDDHGSAFRLKRVTGFEVGPHSTHANLRAVAAQLKKDDPANSPLLIKALTAHGGMKQPAFVSRKAVAFRVLESWVAVAVGTGSIPPMTPPTPPMSPISPTSPVPPMTTGQSAIAAPDLAPGQPESAATVPPVLPTPPSIPAAEPAVRSTPSSAPTIPVIPPIDGRTTQPAPLPVIPGVPQIRSLPTGREPVKPVKAESQFGTGSKPPAPGGVDEFDPAVFNRAVPASK